MCSILLCLTILCIISYKTISEDAYKRTGGAVEYPKVVRCKDLSTLRRARQHTADTFLRKDMKMIGTVAQLDIKKKVHQHDRFGVPSTMMPYYIALMLDSVAVGLVIPLLPFYIMSLGASAVQLSLVVSANYVAQMVGVLVMGKASDVYGRRLVTLACLAASSLSYWCLSYANSLPLVVVARAISGGLGGLMPVIQSALVDSTNQEDRPKYLGRISATFGLGFVLGPALGAMLLGLPVEQKIRVAASLPLLGFLVTLYFATETKRNYEPASLSSFFDEKKLLEKEKHPPLPRPAVLLTSEVILLVLNGFLIMYAFGTETIYAIFLKDNFGYGETALSFLLAVNGLLIGLVQVLLIRPLVQRIGQRGALMLGNLLMATGMLGLAVVRSKPFHFALFSCHLVAYSVAETALVSLISSYSAAQSQGRNLALNQAAQACARVFSPLIAGLLYERSKQNLHSPMPVGALPFLVGGLSPLVAVVVPALLYKLNVSTNYSYASSGTHGNS